MTPYHFFDAVRSFCTVLGGNVTSYGRSKIHNLAVGGVRYSAHQVWLGADIVYDTLPQLEARSEWAARLGLKLVVENDHDHLQPSDWRAG